MKINITPKRCIATAIMIASTMALLLVVGVMVGASVTQKQASPERLMLEAASASAGKNVSLATGLIDEANEAVFILDHLNGNLQCWILNVRTNEIGGIFRTNVLEALPEIKAGSDLDFVLTTGFFRFNNRGNLRPASAVAYVAEGNSGVVAGFGFQFDKAGIQRGILQEGLLGVICKGPIRELQLRDQ